MLVVRNIYDEGLGTSEDIACGVIVPECSKLGTCTCSVLSWIELSAWQWISIIPYSKAELIGYEDAKNALKSNTTWNSMKI